VQLLTKVLNIYHVSNHQNIYRQLWFLFIIYFVHPPGNGFLGRVGKFLRTRRILLAVYTLQDGSNSERRRIRTPLRERESIRIELQIRKNQEVGRVGNEVSMLLL